MNAPANVTLAWPVEARAILATLDPADWTKVLVPYVSGDRFEWHPLTDAAADAHWKLGLLQKEALRRLTSYGSFAEAHEAQQHGYYLRCADRIGNVSEAIDAEFAKRENRPAVRYYVDEEACALLRDAIALPLEGRAH